MRTLMALAVTGWLVSAGASWAEVNCSQVNRYLQTGRTPQDVAETMVISEDEVKKCQAQAQQTTGQQAGGAAAPSGSSQAPAAAPAKQ